MTAANAIGALLPVGGGLVRALLQQRFCFFWCKRCQCCHKAGRSTCCTVRPTITLIITIITIIVVIISIISRSSSDIIAPGVSALLRNLLLESTRALIVAGAAIIRIPAAVSVKRASSKSSCSGVCLAVCSS